MKKQHSQQESRKRFRYQAVSIHPAIMEACPAAHALKGQRFLSNEAPLLPLPDCSNAPGCRCKYQHWDDRRQEDRRASFNGIGDQYHAGEERRYRKDRRSS